MVREKVNIPLPKLATVSAWFRIKDLRIFKMYESLQSTAGKEHPRSVSQSIEIHQSHIQVILSSVSPIILSLYLIITKSVFMLELAICRRESQMQG